MEAIDYSKHIWEGWTVQAFVDELQPVFDMIMTGQSCHDKLETRDQVKK
ncbi:hypothetical protein [Dysgonomonas termitidis]|uniref:Uncharacterized protein n=1 Tax=Dysgonomonas termitidis TaxID=1516126 RepID=A0ABV9L085_9BACT